MKLLIAILILLHSNAFSQTHSDHQIQYRMRLNAGIITDKLQETKAFYTDVLGFGVSFENEFYLLMHTPNKEAELSFLLPDHPSQQALFRKPFKGQGMYLTIEVSDVDKIYAEIKEKGIQIVVDIRNEPWGDRHFAIQDPNGIGIDIVTYLPQEENKIDTMTANKVTWFSIPSDSMDRAIRFYNEVFNWQIEPEIKEKNDDFSFYVALNSQSDSNYVSVEKGTINGCIVKRKIGLPHPAVLVEVDDLDIVIQRVIKAGGQLVSDKIEMTSLNGIFVLVQDTEGNYIELFKNVSK